MTDSDGKFAVSIEGIAAKRLGDEFTVTVTHRDGTSYSFITSPIYFLATKYANSNSIDVEKTLCKAMYQYYTAAAEAQN